MKTNTLVTCQSCGRFTRSNEHQCSFCEAPFPLKASKRSIAAKWGTAATVSMLSVGMMMGCNAYGNPPSCTENSCQTGLICDKDYGYCVPPDSEEPTKRKTPSESIKTDGGVTE